MSPQAEHVIGTWNDTRVVVTGAGGFIGSHLVEKLIALGATVTAFVRYNSRNDAGGLEFIRGKSRNLRVVFGEIRELETVRTTMDDTDIIFHLAALVGIPYSYVHPNEVIEVNTIGTLNVLNAAREHRVRKVVVISTSEVYGSALYLPIDEGHPRQPQSPYAASKIAADAIALSFYRSYELPVTIVRPFNTYGPRQSDRAIIPTIVSQALTKNEVSVGNTAPTRDFTFVTDTVEGMLRVAESEHSIGQEINLGSGREISIEDLALKIVGLIGTNVRVRREEERTRPPKSEVTRLLAANAKARELVGWEPKIHLEDGLRVTINWIRDHLGLYDPTGFRM